jgi:WD40 repeat protein/beta-lactamase regulating signal transducer with metallopeptidase domain
LGAALVQLTLVALVGALAWLAARRSSPALRAAVLLASLVALLVVPLLAAVAPTWLPLPEWICPAVAEPARAPLAAVNPPAPPPSAAPVVTVLATPPSVEAPLDPDVAAKLVGEPKEPKAKAKAILDVSLPAEDVASPARLAVVPATRPGREPGWSLSGVLVGVWLFGALLSLARALGRLALLYHRARRACPVRDPEWTDCADTLARCRGLPPVALRETPAVAAPLALGLFRPVILLPLRRGAWSPVERVLILGHELAHVARRDFLAGLAAELAKCLCWFHPLVYWLTARLRLEQEYAADAWVASESDSREYVRCLARLALEQGRGSGCPAPALWRRRPEILRRIDMLRRNPRGLPCQLDKRAGWAVAALTAAACLVVAGVGPLRSAAPQPAETGATLASQADPQGDPLPAGALARLGTTRLRHGGDVTFVAFAAGKRLLTAGQDGTLRLWDLEKGNEIRRFARPRPVAVKPPKGKPQVGVEAFLMAAGQNNPGSFRVALSPDGKTLAASGGNIIQLWEVETGKEGRRIQTPVNGLSGLLLSPNGRTLAGRSPVGDVFLWSTEDGKLIHHVKPAPRKGDRGLVLAFGGGNRSPVPGMAFTPDGKLLATVATTYHKEEPVRSITFYDAATGKETRKIDGPKGVNLSSVAIAADASLLAYGAGNVIRLCEANTGKEVRQLKAPDGVQSLVFSPDGATLAVRGLNHRVRLLETKTGKELRQLNDAEPERQTGGFIFIANGFSGPEVRALAISPDGKHVASAAGSSVRLWEAATGKELPLVGGHRRSPSAIALTPDGKTAISWGADRVVRRWEAATGKALGAFPAPPRTRLATFSPDGRTVAFVNADNTIRLHDTATGKEVRRLKGPPNGCSALAFAPGGKVLASRASDNTLRLHDLARDVVLRQMNVQRRPRQRDGVVFFFGGSGGGSPGTGPGLTFSPDGKLLATPRPGNRDLSNTIVFFDTVTGKELRKLTSNQPIASFAFSPDSRTLAAEHPDRTVTLWEVASGKERARLGKAVANQPRGNGGARLALDLDVDGLVGGGFSEPGGPVGLAWSPDGRALVVRGADRTVRIHDATTGKMIGKLAGHGGRIETVSFAPGGKAVASGAADTTVLLWDAVASLKDLAKPETIELTGDEVKALWGDLAGEDAKKALLGIHKLASGAKQAVPFLGQELKPAARIDPKKIAGWIADLDSEKFNVRQAAMSRLVKVGEQAVPALQKLLASSPALEVRKRAEELVDRLTGGVLTSEQLRVVRAVEALERMGGPDARQVLQKLAGGAPGALPTREAQAALERMKVGG